MKIGIIGSGNVAQSLAKGFVAEGHSVTIGTRNATKKELDQFKEENKAVVIADFSTAANYGKLLVLAVKGTAAVEAIELCGRENLIGKIVIDATNPIADAPPLNGILQYFTGPNESLMEKLQLLVPEARFVKAFSSVGSGLMYKPSFKEGQPTMFIAGNDDDAKKAVNSILVSFGWEAEDIGKAEGARAIEPLAILWCAPGFLRNDWSHAFKFLKS